MDRHTQPSTPAPPEQTPESTPELAPRPAPGPTPSPCRSGAGSGGGRGWGAARRASSERAARAREERLGLSDRIVPLTRWLEVEDRGLVLAMLRDGLSAAALARAGGALPEGDPSGGGGGAAVRRRARALTRRLRQIIDRLTSARCLFVLSHLESEGAPGVHRSGQGPWGARRKRIALLCVVRGQSVRRAADDLGMTYHAVRRELQVIQAQFEAARPGAAS